MKKANRPSRTVRAIRCRISALTSRKFQRRRGSMLVLAIVVAAAVAAMPLVSASASSPWSSPSQDGLGIQSGKVKHVWLIILENKSYDATFTGLNKNTYLWQTFPLREHC